MKVLAIISAVGGLAAILLAILTVTAKFNLFGLTGAGYLRGASSLFLLALVMMVYDKIYCR